MNGMMRQEVNEAIYAGEKALESLYMAQEKLNSARTWGLLDLFGGGSITGLIKHARLGDASSYMEQARYDLECFQKELRDVVMEGDLRLEIGSFLSFADFFFDGFLADYMVQSKINDARQQVKEAIRRVENLLEQLKRY